MSVLARQSVSQSENAVLESLSALLTDPQTFAQRIADLKAQEAAITAQIELVAPANDILRLHEEAQHDRELAAKALQEAQMQAGELQRMGQERADALLQSAQTEVEHLRASLQQDFAMRMSALEADWKARQEQLVVDAQQQAARWQAAQEEVDAIKTQVANQQGFLQEQTTRFAELVATLSQINQTQAVAIQDLLTIPQRVMDLTQGRSAS